GYAPGKAVLRQADASKVTTTFRDTSYWIHDDGFTGVRDMLVGGKVFHITSVFPSEAKATPTDKLLSLIDADLSKEAHSA
ncbi:MAG TPA: hypothetical protein VN421_14145, partial [Pseudoflavonifractor sp.]|nr:hypothetical protein [Pseudoflavonifractor sp.]